MSSHTFTREELYEFVWSEPMIKLAARYGISGNGLAKACRKAEIPVPERGYWNKMPVATCFILPTTGSTFALDFCTN